MKKWIIANWKCNVEANEAKQLAKACNNIKSDNCEVGIAAPNIYLSELAKENANVHFGVQTISHLGEGAFTGEVSVDLVKSAGANFAIVGHSERREIFNENDELIRHKVEACLNGNLMPVLCVGESLSVRENKQHLPLMYAQIRSVFEGLKLNSANDIVVAYEPVWAIGTGKIPTLQEIEEVHLYIQNLLEELHPNLGKNIAILYGGSVKPNNASDIFKTRGVSGALVGGASLKADSFSKIIAAI